MAKPHRFYAYAYASIVACMSLAAACDDVQPCAVAGSVEACACAPGMQGARLCEAEHTWGECNCSGAIALPNPIEPITGGSGGATGGTGAAGAGGSGLGGVGGSGGVMSIPDGGADEDGGPTTDGGSGGMGGAGAGGMGGTGGMEPENPYGACMVNADCQTNADCSITPNSPEDATVCAPKCTEVSECPVPEGMYEATVQCVTNYCRIDCTPVLFEPLLSCPAGMVCIAPLFGVPYCHDDGL